MLSTIYTNRSEYYLQLMKGHFEKIQISNEKDFEMIRSQIINLYTEHFYNKREKSREFLYFQNLDIISKRLEQKGFNNMLCIAFIHETLTMLLEEYTFEIYQNQNELSIN